MGFVAKKMGGDKNGLEEFFKPTPKPIPGKMPKKGSIRKQRMGKKRG